MVRRARARSARLEEDTVNSRSSTAGFSSTLNAMLIAVIIVAAMYFAREVLIPVALAGILSFMLAPLVRLLQKIRLPRLISVLIVVGLAFAAIFALGKTLVAQVERLAQDLPTYQSTIEKKIEVIRGADARTGTLERARVVLSQLNKELSGEHKPSEGAPPQPTDLGTNEQTLIPVEVHEPPGSPLATVAALINPLLGPLATTTLIVVFVIFMLIQQQDLRDRLIRLVGSTDIAHTTAALDDGARRLSRFFLTQLSINAGFGTAVGLGLWAIGIPSAFVWGVLAGILRFVPFVGPVLGIIFPLALALSVGTGWSMALWTIGLFVALEGVTGQVIEPIFHGRSTGLTPIAIIMAATFWAWLWGPVGLVLATPLTVVLVVLGRHVEALNFFEILLGDEPALSDSEVFYHRMLSNDPLEVVEHAKAFMAEHSLSHYYDQVARPALALAHKDVVRGALDDEKAETFTAAVESVFADIVLEYADLPKDTEGTSAEEPRLPVLTPDDLMGAWRSETPLVSIGTHSRLDGVAASMVATLATAHGVGARVQAPGAFAAAKLTSLDLSTAALICLSYFDFRTTARVRYAARRARSRAPKAKLMLGLWTAPDASLEAIKKEVGADFVVNTLHDAATIILAEATGGRPVGSQIKAPSAALESSAPVEPDPTLATAKA
jgi:predicted PurR-regulated permease PerM